MFPGTKQTLYLVCALIAAGCTGGLPADDKAAKPAAAAAASPGAAAGKRVAARSTTDAEDDAATAQYSVYDAVLGQLISRSPDATFLVKEQTSLESPGQQVSNSTIKFLAQKLPSLSQETLDDFAARNRASSTLQNLFGHKVVLISAQEEEDALGDEKGWEKLRDKYHSNGVVTFSAVGMNRQLNQAVVYVGHRRGLLDGAGRYCLLVKDGGEWRIKEKVDVWFS